MESFHKLFVLAVYTVIYLIAQTTMGQVSTPVSDINQQVPAIIPNSPSAAAFKEYIDNPIGYYTGIPQIGLPLYQVDINGFSLPISLSYHAGGIKIEEVASNVGMGWSLNAGGMITRQVKDLPDDESPYNCANSWYGTDAPLITNFSNCGCGLLWAFDADVDDAFDGITTHNINLSSYSGSAIAFLRKFYSLVTDLQWNDHYLLDRVDKEPDIFYFNFAGYTGKFVFDINGVEPVITMYPYQNLKIEYETDEFKKLSKFTITDEKGVKYLFDAVEFTTAYRRSNFNSVPDYDNGLGGKIKFVRTGNGYLEYRSSWYLSRIETPTGNFLDFTYEDEGYQNATRGAQQTGLAFTRPPTDDLNYDPNDIDDDALTVDGYHNSLSINETRLTGQRVKSIENEHQYIEFNYNNAREDIEYIEPLNLLANMDELAESIENLQQRLVSTYSFNIDYLQLFEALIKNGDPQEVDEAGRSTQQLFNASFVISDITKIDATTFSGNIVLSGYQNSLNSTLSSNSIDHLNELLNVEYPVTISENSSGVEVEWAGYGEFMDGTGYGGTGSYESLEHPRSLDEIIIYHKTEEGLHRIKKFAFNYDYFASNGNEPINIEELGGRPPHAIEISDPAAYYKRLRLLSVREFGKTDDAFTPPYHFQYKHKDFTGNSDHTLPHRLSFQRDFWGYYTPSTDNKTLIPSVWVYPDHYDLKDSRHFRVLRKPEGTFTGREYLLPGADRNPVAGYSDIGLLTKLIYPTGGSTSYEYEMNVFGDEGTEYQGGGNRIRTVTKSTQDAVDIVYNYSYEKSGSSSGEIVHMPLFAVRDLSLGYLDDYNDDSERGYKIHTTRYSSPMMSLETTNGSFVGYKEVTESISGNGRSVYHFSMPGSWGVKTDGAEDCDEATDGYCDGFYSLTEVEDLLHSNNSEERNASNYFFDFHPAAPNTYPYPNNPNYDWQRGHLLKKEVYDEAGFKVSEKEIVYDNYMPYERTTPRSVYGIKIGHHYPLLADKTTLPSSEGAIALRVAKYELLTDVSKVVTQEIERTYNQEDQGSYIELVKDYFYDNSDYKLLTKTSLENSKGEVIETNNYYVNDSVPENMTKDEVKDEMVDRNIIISPIKQEIINNGVLIKGQLNTFEIDEYDNVILGGTEVLDVNSSNYVPDITYSKYDQKGNLLEYTGRDGVTNTFIWSYDKKYPVAKLMNTTYQNVLDANGENATSELENSQNYVYIESALQLLRESVNSLNGSSSFMEDVQLTTYTYEPLVGMLNETDPNNITLLYEYDELNRLRFVRDQGNNIIKHYEYGYGTEWLTHVTQPIDVEIVADYFHIPNEPSEINTNIISMSYREGATFLWSLLGSDSIYGQSINHAFVSTGKQLVELDIIHPGYPDGYSVNKEVCVSDHDWSITYDNVTDGVDFSDRNAEYYFQAGIYDYETCFEFSDFTILWQYRQDWSETWKDIIEGSFSSRYEINLNDYYPTNDDFYIRFIITNAKSEQVKTSSSEFINNLTE